jgi:hypothetical protein
MPIAKSEQAIGSCPPSERMNSPLERHKVRLRGLGGPAALGFPRIGASATMKPAQGNAWVRKRYHSAGWIRSGAR